MHLSVRSPRFRIFHEFFFWLFFADCILLTILGQCPVEDPYILVGQLAAVWFFIHLLLITPTISWLEHTLALKNTQGLAA
jgi:ubiquinol-cytochrome c reductase cytochrome b subunit